MPALAAAGLAGLGALFMVTHQQPRHDGGGRRTARVYATFRQQHRRTDQPGRHHRPASDASRFRVRAPPSCSSASRTARISARPRCTRSPKRWRRRARVDIQPVLISVDPERDTPEAMRQYVTTNGFPPGLVGLTGTPEQVRAAANAFNAQYRKGEAQKAIPASTTSITPPCSMSWTRIGGHGRP